jgi:hypothetical protein
MNHLTPFNPSDVPIIYAPDACSRSIHPCLQKPAKATNQLQLLFFYRSVDAGNALPPALRSSPTLPVFKGGLKFLISQPIFMVPLLQSELVCHNYVIFIHLMCHF